MCSGSTARSRISSQVESKAPTMSSQCQAPSQVAGVTSRKDCGASALGHSALAELDLFQWWSEVIEVPVVAEGALTPALIGQLAPITDFIALGPEIWSEADPVEALAHLWR